MEGEHLRTISELYERHAAAVHRYALRRSDPDTADDVTAHVFLVAWRRRDAMPAEPLPWLYGVARHALADQRRGLSRRHRLHDRLERLAVVPGDDLELPDRDLAGALKRLSPADREALLLRYWEELEPAEIGRVMGCSRTAAAVRLHRARGRLRRELDAPGAQHAPGEGQAQPCVERAEST